MVFDFVVDRNARFSRFRFGLRFWKTKNATFYTIWFAPRLNGNLKICTILYFLVVFFCRFSWRHPGFFKAFLRGWKRLGKLFFAILKTISIFSMFKLLSKILHGCYTTFVFEEFWKKLINSSKSAKQVGIL